jgi:hypothetical protein
LSARFEIELSFGFILMEITVDQTMACGTSRIIILGRLLHLQSQAHVHCRIVVHKRDINPLETQFLGTPVKDASILKLYSLLCFNEVLAALQILHTTHVNLPPDCLAGKIETIPVI